MLHWLCFSLFLLFSSFHRSITVFATTVNTSNITSETLAWQALYNATDGKNWYRCSEVNSTPCECSLVNCDENGSVVKIDLQANTLQGSLPSEIGNFLSLQHLDISFNHLTNTLPVSLFTLSSLSYLDISSNLFNGSIPSFSSFSPTNALNVLVLANNHFTGCFPSLLPILSSLSMFRIDRNLLGSFLHPNVIDFILERNDLRLAFLLSNANPSNQFWCPVANYSELMRVGVLSGGCTPLSYRDNPVTYTLTGAEHPDPIKPNVPNFVTSGCPLSFNVTPPLPAGLILDPLSGIISGLPKQPSAAQDFVIYATDGHVTTSVTVSITVIGSVLNSARYDVLLVMLAIMALAAIFAVLLRHLQKRQRGHEEDVTTGLTKLVVANSALSESLPSHEAALPLHLRLKLAAIYLKDGAAGRKLAKVNSAADFRLYTFTRSKWWEYLCFIASCAYLLLSIPEFDFHDGPTSNPWWLIFLEIVILAIHVIDIYLSWRCLVSFTSRMIDGTRGTVAVVSVIDLVLHYSFGWLRFSRALRPLLLVLRWQAFRKQVFGILSAIPSVFRVMCVIGMFIFFSAFVAFLLFVHIPGFIPFSSLGDAVWNLFLVNAVLAYSLNLLTPILLDEDSAIVAMWFFLLFILFTNYFLLKLIVSYTNASFSSYSSMNEEEKKKKQKKAYTKVFEMLLGEEKKEITLHMFIMFAQILKPVLDECVCETLFKCVVVSSSNKKNNNNNVSNNTITTLEEFSLLSQILLLNIKTPQFSGNNNSHNHHHHNQHTHTSSSSSSSSASSSSAFSPASPGPVPSSSTLSVPLRSSGDFSSSSKTPFSSSTPPLTHTPTTTTITATHTPPSSHIQKNNNVHTAATTATTIATTANKMHTVSSDVFNSQDVEEDEMGELEEEEPEGDIVHVANTHASSSSSSLPLSSPPPPPPPPPPASQPLSSSSLSSSSSSSSWTRARRFVRRCCKYSFPVRCGGKSSNINSSDNSSAAVVMHIRPSRLLIRLLVLLSTIQIWAAATQVHDGHMDKNVKLLGQLLAFVFAVELLLKLFSTGPRRSYLAEFTWTAAAFCYCYWGEHQGTTLFNSILLCISFTRVTKLMRGFSQTSRMLRVLDEALWDAALLLVVYTLLLYSFNSIAMGLYSDVLISETTDTRLTKTNWYMSYRTALNFETFPRGLFTMFVCSVMGGRWMDVMTAAVQASEGPDFLAYLLFVAFRVICTMMFLPLSTGMLLQIFMKSQTLVNAEMDGKGVFSKAVIRGSDGKLFLFATQRTGIPLPACLASVNEEVFSKALSSDESHIHHKEVEQKTELLMRKSTDTKGLKTPLLVTDHDDDAD